MVPSLVMVVRRCPTLPHPVECSTMGAVGLSFRVRDGTGRFPHAMAAETLCHHPCGGGEVSCDCYVKSYVVISMVPVLFIPRCGLLFGDRRVNASTLPTLLKCCWVCGSGYRLISTGQLHTLLCFHVRPINPVVCWGPLPPNGGWKSHLEVGFPLRCFQRLSRPNVANQPCTWRYNWHTRGSSVPVLSY